MDRYEGASPEDKLKYVQEGIQGVLNTHFRRPGYFLRRFGELLERINKSLNEIEMQIRKEKEDN